ncbi:PREDICTED: LOW QUALITY PROTEIN: uncharacterized protein C6orf223 homolog [Ceratotherium simum simum]|uniref:LOW QUALITY PROTEIN: uncharacterized protein C6orf223 homolog n=1 Tax=Ceratotherium simum simum TaxID=73337 RepID=A0ABM1CER1_CERSS|nr:PREDICTED: LOW QUALITY PROTEIN: uncharacterized protein C6orf223 homolog [Ceratotherium simum simum]
MMPLAEAGAPAQGGGPAGTGWASLRSKTPRHKQPTWAPTLLKARASRRSSETPAVLMDQKRGCISPPARREQATRLGTRDQTRCPGKIRWIEERPLEAGGGAGHATPGPALLCPRKWGARRAVPGQESLLRGLGCPLRPHPGFRESDSAEPASLHLLQHTRSARRNYRIAGARLMRSNYPPPLSSAALCGAGPTCRN